MRLRSSLAALALVLSGTLGSGVPEGEQATAIQKPAASPPPKRPNARQLLEADVQAHNAARPENGARITLTLSEKAIRTQDTAVEETFDGNPRTRCVVTHAPYVFRVDLVAQLPITEINFMQDQYASAAIPREVEVTLSDGTVLKKALEATRPTQTDPMPRQRLAVGKDVAWFEVNVVSVEPGTGKDGVAANHGGLGEIEAITTADLKVLLELPNYNQSMPTHVEGRSPRNDYSNVKVTMPAKIGLQGHPRLFMSRAEVLGWRGELAKTERGRAALQAVLDVAGNADALTIVMPDPKVPAQLKDRGDAAALAHGRLSNAAGRMGWAYQLTDREVYAEKTREILMGYAGLYPDGYVEHKGVNRNDAAKVMAQRLSEAMWLIPLIQAYDMVHDAPCMSDEDRMLIENGLLRPALTLINAKRDATTEVRQRTARNPNWRTEDPSTLGRGTGNARNFYNVAFVQGGIVLGDQDWIDVGAADTRQMIALGIKDDGMWGEGAIGYQYFARMALVACLEPLARQGIDVYSSNTSRFKNLFDAVYNYAYPDGTMPGINDSGRVSVGGDYKAMAYDYAWLRYRDPNYCAPINAAPRQIFQSDSVYFPAVVYDLLPEQPLQGVGSMVLDGLGFGILRGQDAGGPTFLLMNYGAQAGSHGHPDRLNLLVFADGDELCGEPQFYKYEDTRHLDWTKTTLSHFTLTIDESNQMPGGGRLVGFFDAGAVKVMRSQCASAYPGVGLDRTVVQMPGYLVDIYRAWGKTSHTFDYPLCFAGELDSLQGVDSASLAPMSQTQPGYKAFRTRAPFTTNGNWTGQWGRAAKLAKPATTDAPSVRGSPANEVKVTVLGDGDTQVFAGVGIDAQHRTVLRRKGLSTVFASVIDPFKASDVVKSAERIGVEGPLPAYGLKVSRTDGGTDLVLVRFDPQARGKPGEASTFAGGSTDALVSVVRLDAAGESLEVGMVGGTHLTYGEAAVTLPAAGSRWSKEGSER